MVKEGASTTPRNPSLFWLCFLPILGCASRDCAPDATAVRTRAMSDSRVLAASIEKTVRESTGPFNVLVLSGGGSHGAFGVGVLSGWRESGRPEFDVVTGVSTGALIATHAFLGAPEDDKVLEEIYTTVRDGDIFRKRWFFTLPFSSSIATLAPLERLIARTVTDETIARVTAAGPRKIFIGTTNLDEGRLKVWDMSALARAGDYATYRAVLLASSSVPGLYPPVEINGALHCDGGVREQLFLREVMLDLAQARAKDVTIHVILNGQVDAGATCVQPSLLPLALRGVEILAAASAVGNLYQSKAVADAIKAKWRLARISPFVDVPFGAQTFDPEGMRKLFEDGWTFGKENSWEAQVPAVQDATRVFEVKP